jgi:hypothetical protein
MTLTRAHLFVALVPGVLGAISTVLAVSCSSSSSPSTQDSGMDVTTHDVRPDAAHDAPPPMDAGAKDSGHKDADAEVCTQTPGPADAEYHGCGTTIGNCLGVGEFCNGQAEAGATCLTAAAANPSGSAFCVPWNTWDIPNTENPDGGYSEAGSCVVIYNGTNCGAGCGPGATCCIISSINAGVCFATSCVPWITAPDADIEPPGIVCGDM